MILAVGLCAAAQDTVDNPTRELTKKEKKAIEKRNKEIKDSIAHEDAIKAIQDSVYILLVDKTMERNIDDESRALNFVIVEKNKMLVQTGQARTYTGNNNLGGITVMTEIVGDVKTEVKKNGEVNSKFKVKDTFLSGDVRVKLYKKGNYGEVNILHTKSGQHITYFGNFVPFKQSMVGSAIEVGKLYVPGAWDPFTMGDKRDVGVLMDYLTGKR